MKGNWTNGLFVLDCKIICLTPWNARLVQEQHEELAGKLAGYK